MLKNEPFLSNQRFKKGVFFFEKSPFLFFYEMVTLFLEQLKIASFCNEFPRYIIISQSKMVSEIFLQLIHMFRY